MALDEQRRPDTAVILVAAHDQQRWTEFAQFLLQIVDRRAFCLHAAQHPRQTDAGMAFVDAPEFGEATGILQHLRGAGGRNAALFQCGGRTRGFEQYCVCFGGFQESFARRRIGTGAGAECCHRQRHRRITHAELQRRIGSHRAADNMRLAQAEVAQHLGNVVDGDAPGIFAARGRHVRRRIAARVECNATIATGKKPQLRFPAAGIARELVHENQRHAFAGLVVMKPGLVAGNGVGHGKASSVRIPRQ